MEDSEHDSDEDQRKEQRMNETNQKRSEVNTEKVDRALEQKENGLVRAASSARNTVVASAAVPIRLASRAR